MTQNIYLLNLLPSSPSFIWIVQNIKQDITEWTLVYQKKGEPREEVSQESGGNSFIHSSNRRLLSSSLYRKMISAFLYHCHELNRKWLENEKMARKVKLPANDKRATLQWILRQAWTAPKYAGRREPLELNTNEFLFSENIIVTASLRGLLLVVRCLD